MKTVYRAPADEAWALFARVPVIHLAATDPDGQPMLRTVHGVVVGGSIAFHGGDHGDKRVLLERPVIAVAEEIVAEIPSYFIDPERACPATTYYRSAMIHGRLRRVEDLDRKAEVVRALMERFQPEGGYAAIAADDPRYRTPLRTLLVAEIVPDRISAKHKLGQNRKPEQIANVASCLWRRGNPGDLPAIRAICDAHPGRPVPALLRGPGGAVLCPAPDADDARAAAELLAPQYWNHGVAPATIARAQLGSRAWVVARDPRSGAVIATARANSDDARYAYVQDVAVSESWRGRGLGRAVMSLLLDHPRVRGCQVVRLQTADAQPFYERFGFVAGRGTYPEMELTRGAL